MLLSVRAKPEIVVGQHYKQLVTNSRCLTYASGFVRLFVNYKQTITQILFSFCLKCGSSTFTRIRFMFSVSFAPHSRCPLSPIAVSLHRSRTKSTKTMIRVYIIRESVRQTDGLRPGRTPTAGLVAVGVRRVAGRVVVVVIRLDRVGEVHQIAGHGQTMTSGCNRHEAEKHERSDQ
jgi:hypothetical protein